MDDIERLKKSNGWSREVEVFLIDVEKSIPKGKFTISKRNGNSYWYYNKSSGTNRLIYLCPISEKGSDINSFLHSVQILRKKITNPETFVKRINLSDVISQYIDELREEGKSNKLGTERTKKTIHDLIYHLNTFKEFSSRRKILLTDCSRIEFGNTIVDYISELTLKYKPNTIRRHISTIKMFFNDLVEPKRGKAHLKTHPISSHFIKRNFNFRSKNHDEKENFYSEKLYNDLFELCGKKVRNVWTSFLKNGYKEVNPSDVVYFTTLLQLNYGFRIGELLECFKSEEIKKRYYRGKGGYSFLLKNKNGMDYFIRIYMKQRFGDVFIDYGIYSWIEPPNDIDYVRLEKEELSSEPFVTNIIDVMLTLFSNSKYLISTDRSDFFRLFREVIVNTEGFGIRGITKSHDLRDMCVNFLIHTKDYTPAQISQLTRHTISTLETYYLHSSEKISEQLSGKLKTKGRYAEVVRKRRDGSK